MATALPLEQHMEHTACTDMASANTHLAAAALESPSSPAHGFVCKPVQVVPLATVLTGCTLGPDNALLDLRTH